MYLELKATEKDIFGFINVKQYSLAGLPSNKPPIQNKLPN